MTAIVAFVNQKGGVGKTSVTLGMASAAWAAGHQVAVVDLDPQGSATWVLGLDPAEVEQSTAEVVLAGRAGAAAKAMVPSAWGEDVLVLPASPRLQPLEAGDGRDPAHRLRRSLAGVEDLVDLVLVDC